MLKKILATSGIRKLLDYVFTQRELFWLDDILPGAKIDDKDNKKKNNQNSNEKADENGKNFSRKSSVRHLFLLTLCVCMTCLSSNLF